MPDPSPEPTFFDVFISYQRDDGEQADRIYDALKGRGLRPAKDTRDLVPGERDYQKRLEELLHHSAKLIFLISENSVNSKPCRQELALAEAAGITIIPVRLDDTSLEQLPKQVRKAQYVRLSSEEHWETNLPKIEDAVQRNLEWEKQKPYYLELAHKKHLLSNSQAVRDLEDWLATRPPNIEAPPPAVLGLLDESRRHIDSVRRWRFTGVSVVLLVLVASVFWVSVALTNERDALAREKAALTQEALARFRAEVRAANGLVHQGTSEAWELLVGASQAYASIAGQRAALEAIDKEVLTTALKALLNQRALRVENDSAQQYEIVDFIPDGTGLLLSQGTELHLIDTNTSHLRARFPGLGQPLRVWPVGDHHVGLLICTDVPCISQFSDLANEDDYETYLEFYIEYFNLDSQTFTAAQRDQAWEILDDYSRLIYADLTRGKLSFAIVDGAAADAISLSASICDISLCVGSISSDVRTLDIIDAPLAQLRVEAEISGFLLSSNLVPIGSGLKEAHVSPPVYRLDPNTQATTNDFLHKGGTVIRTNLLYSLVEIHIPQDDGSWTVNTLCLEYSASDDDCKSEVGAQVLDISDDGQFVLITSRTQGTGGGAGEHQTALIGTETGAVLWRNQTISRFGAFAKDVSSFSVVDWLGHIEVRSLPAFDSLYVHDTTVNHDFNGFNHPNKAVVYHPHLPFAAVSEEDGNVVLLDLTPVPDFAKNTIPLPSMRGICRKPNEGPFRTIYYGKPRPFNIYDWREVESEIQRQQVQLPYFYPPFSAKVDGDTLLIEGSSETLKIPMWNELLADGLDNFPPKDSILAHVSEDGLSIALWGTEADDTESDIARWYWVAVSRDGPDWRISGSGDFEGSNRLRMKPRFAFNDGILFRTGQNCTIEAVNPLSETPLWTGTFAFVQDQMLEVRSDDGVVLAYSNEWYGWLALQLFDIRTGAAGPWVNVPENIIQTQDTRQIASFNPSISLNLPPWGDRLRRMLLVDGK